MANIKSSAKRVLVSRVRAERNKADKSELKTTIKKFDAAATEGNRENAEAAYKAAVKTVDRAVSRVCSTRTTQLARSPAWLPK